MANIKNIVITIGISLFVLATISVWVAYKKGEIAQPVLGDGDAVPGPITIEEEIPLTEEDAMDTNTNPTVTFKTSLGDVTLELFEDRMPITAGNFLTLAREGFYDGTKFHRVIDGFMIQGGDPNSRGDNTAVYGQGGPGYTITDEFVEGEDFSNVRGTIAMANIGQPNSGGSQFFINVVDNTGLDFNKEPLSSKHPVFGRVIDGMDIVDAISKVETAARDVPVTPVVIEDIVIGESEEN